MSCFTWALFISPSGLSSWLHLTFLDYFKLFLTLCSITMQWNFILANIFRTFEFSNCSINLFLTFKKGYVISPKILVSPFQRCLFDLLLVTNLSKLFSIVANHASKSLTNLQPYFGSIVQELLQLFCQKCRNRRGDVEFWEWPHCRAAFFGWN